MPYVLIYKKNWNSYHPNDVDRRKYDSSMKSKNVIIKNVFGTLKNK
jgi:hypothetical protein